MGELKSTTNVQIKTHLEVWLNMSMWDWIVLKDDHPMPQMCILQNAQLQNNPPHRLIYPHVQNFGTSL
jgi:hypothetical protein